MTNYFKKSLYNLYLIFFKPITFRETYKDISRFEILKLLIQQIPFMVLIPVVVTSFVGSSYELLSFEFDWYNALNELLRGLAIGVAGGMAVSIVVGVAGGLAFSVVVGVIGSVAFSLAFGVAFVIAGDVVEGVVLGVAVGAAIGVVIGVVIGIIAVDVVMALGVIYIMACSVMLVIEVMSREMGVRDMGVVAFGVAFIVTLILSYFRLPYSLIYPFFYLYFKKRAGWHRFEKLRIYYDELICFPLPKLHRLLFSFVQSDRKSGMEAIDFIIKKHPHQISQARRALSEIAIDDLNSIKDFSQLSKAKGIIDFMDNLPEKAVPKGFETGNRFIGEIADLVAQYNDFTTFYSRNKQLETIYSKVNQFLIATAFLKGYSGKGFQKVAFSWLTSVEKEKEALQSQIEAEPIPNPYVVGNPLRVEDKEVFQGRQHVARILENEIMGGKRISPLLFFGKRRIGKTSTLLNLKKLFGPHILPVYLDCQDVRVYSSDARFLHHMLLEIEKEIKKQRTPIIDMKSLPELTKFEKNAFEIFSNLFDDFVHQLESKNYRILLCMDEYERLDRAYAAQRITNDLLDQIRHFIQHQERIVFLFSGSHRMTESNTIRWSDYLINVKTVKLSFLDTKSAEKLITAPLPDWPLTFEPGVVDEILRITHCQPYLLQAVTSDLVDYLNIQKKFVASMEDLEEAITRVLVTAELYFQNTWEEDLKEEERKLILEYLRKDGDIDLEANKETLHGLVINDIFEIVEERHIFVIDLFKRWIKKTQPV